MSRFIIYPFLIIIGLIAVSSFNYFTAEPGMDCMLVYVDNFNEGCMYEFTDETGTYTHIDECFEEFQENKIGDARGCFITKNGLPDIMNISYCNTTKFYRFIGI